MGWGDWKPGVTGGVMSGLAVALLVVITPLAISFGVQGALSITGEEKPGPRMPEDANGYWWEENGNCTLPVPSVTWTVTTNHPSGSNLVTQGNDLSSSNPEDCGLNEEIAFGLPTAFIPWNHSLVTFSVEMWGSDYETTCPTDKCSAHTFDWWVTINGTKVFGNDSHAIAENWQAHYVSAQWRDYQYWPIEYDLTTYEQLTLYIEMNGSNSSANHTVILHMDNFTDAGGGDLWAPWNWDGGFYLKGNSTVANASFTQFWVSTTLYALAAMNGILAIGATRLWNPLSDKAKKGADNVVRIEVGS